MDRSFLRHAVIFGIGTVLIPVAGIVLLPLYTNYLDPDGMGTLEFVNRIAEVVGICAMSAGIQQATQAFYLHAKNKRQKDSLAATLLALFLVALLCGALIFAPLLLTFHRQLGVENPTMLFVGIGSYLILVSLEIPLALMRCRLESIRFVTISVLLFVFRVGATVYTVAVLHQGIWGVWTAMAAVGFVFAVLLYCNEMRLGSFVPDFSQTGQIVRFALPLVPGGVLLFLLFHGDRFFLVWFWDNAEVGLYATGYKIASVVAMCSATPLLRVWAVYQYEWMLRDDGKPLCAKWFLRLTVLYCFIGLVVAIFCPELLRTIAAKSYENAAEVVPPLILAGLFLNLSYMLEGVFYVFRKTILKLYVNLIATVATLEFCVFLIPHYGMHGAAWGAVLGFFTLFLCTVVFSRHVYPIPLPWLRFFVTIFGGITLLCAASILEPTFGLGTKFAALFLATGLFVPVVVSRQ